MRERVKSKIRADVRSVLQRLPVLKTSIGTHATDHKTKQEKNNFYLMYIESYRGCSHLFYPIVHVNCIADSFRSSTCVVHYFKR